MNRQTLNIWQFVINHNTDRINQESLSVARPPNPTVSSVPTDSRPISWSSLRSALLFRRPFVLRRALLFGRGLPFGRCLLFGGALLLRTALLFRRRLLFRGLLLLRLHRFGQFADFESLRRLSLLQNARIEPLFDCGPKIGIEGPSPFLLVVDLDPMRYGRPRRSFPVLEGPNGADHHFQIRCIVLFGRCRLSRHFGIWYLVRSRSKEDGS